MQRSLRKETLHWIGRQRDRIVMRPYFEAETLLTGFREAVAVVEGHLERMKRTKETPLSPDMSSETVREYLFGAITDPEEEALEYSFRLLENLRGRDFSVVAGYITGLRAERYGAGKAEIRRHEEAIMCLTNARDEGLVSLYGEIVGHRHRERDANRLGLEVLPPYHITFPQDLL